MYYHSFKDGVSFILISTFVYSVCVQMAMWAMMAAPLYMSNDLRTLRQWQKDILMNQEVIAVDQVSITPCLHKVYQ